MTATASITVTFAHMKRFKRILAVVYPYVRNKFIFTGLLFLLWIGFIDDNNIVAQVKSRLKLAEVKREREFYLQETLQSSEDLKLLQNDRALLEKFAREKYLMKKENEEIFIFTTEE
ncbi:MAG: septum formation initiator family protein [Flavobacteriales bacterium]|nr:septum formation initiator family protein [Flavobacteriales bacterium]